MNNKHITRSNPKFTYEDILNNLISFKLESNDADDIKLRITDGNFTVVSTFYVKKLSTNVLEKDPEIGLISETSS